MIIQQTLNMERTINQERDINIYYDYLVMRSLFFIGWEDLYIKSKPVEKAIYYMKYENDRRKSLNSITKKFQKSVNNGI